MERGGKSSKKRAIVATARKLAVLLFRLWKRDEEWKPLYNNETPPATETSAANADRPKPTVQADCACAPDDTGDRERRRIDCSASGGDALLAEGPIPVALIRAKMLGEPVPDVR